MLGDKTWQLSESMNRFMEQATEKKHAFGMTTLSNCQTVVHIPADR